MPGTDSEVLARFVRGDRDAFESLFRQHQREVYQWAVRVVRDWADAEDIVVESFWRAYRSRARFDATRSFGAWMRRITTHVAIDHLNAARRRAWVSLDSNPPLTGRAPTADGNSVTAGPASTDEITRAFRALPPKLRVVANLALIDEQPLAEIADALDVPIGTVKSRLFRATRSLRRSLTSLGVQR